MNATEIQNALKTLLEEMGFIYGDKDEDEPIAEIATYAEHGVMTNNAGLVITLADRSQYHMTIVQSN